MFRRGRRASGVAVIAMTNAPGPVFLFPVFFFLHPVHHIFREAARSLDHVGDESEDGELQSHDEENERCQEPVAIRCDLELLDIEGEKYGEKSQCNRHEDEPGNAEEFQGAYVAHRLYDNARRRGDELSDGAHDTRFAPGEVRDMDRDPDDFEILADGVDDRLLRVGEIAREVEPQHGFSVERAESAREVVDACFEKSAHDARGEAVERVFDPRDVLGFLVFVTETIRHDHVRMAFEDGGEKCRDIAGIELAVRVDVDEEIGAMLERIFHRRAKCLANAAVGRVRMDEVRAGITRRLRRGIG